MVTAASSRLHPSFMNCVQCELSGVTNDAPAGPPVRPEIEVCRAAGS
jgi:hypothetical protein